MVMMRMECRERKRERNYCPKPNLTMIMMMVTMIRRRMAMKNDDHVDGGVLGGKERN